MRERGLLRYWTLMLDALLLSTGLAMDCMVVAAAYGAARRDSAQSLRIAAVFGAFHPAMAGIGLVLGTIAEGAIASFDHWLAFGLLTLVGGRMIFAAVRGAQQVTDAVLGWRTLILLAFATSIDAIAAGITLPLIDSPPAITLILLGSVTVAMTVIGVHVGAVLGNRLGRGLGALGGVAILAIGVRVLVQHLL